MGSIESKLDKTVARLEDQLELWGAKLNELAAKLDVASQEAKSGARRQLEDAKTKLEVARSKLDEAKVAGADRWGSFRAAVESAWRDVEHAVHKLVH